MRRNSSKQAALARRCHTHPKSPGTWAGAAGTSLPNTRAVIDRGGQVPAPAGASRQERRRHHRVGVPPMYTLVRVRVRHDVPLDGHVLDLSEAGIAVQLDERIPPGQLVSLKFRIAGLGRVWDGEWCETPATAIVLRQDGLEDYPVGPYKQALCFVHIPLKAQRQIAQFVESQREQAVASRKTHYE